MDFFESTQKEILNNSGHQKWHKVTVRHFNDNNLEVSFMPYETWSEMSEDDLQRPLSNRGEGDRDKSKEVAARRAKRKVRHLCKMLKARYMVTLTTKKIITDINEFQSYFQEFVRRIRKVTNFQYVATLELQKRGALHLHIAVATRQDYKLLWAVWYSIVGKSQGRVHVTSGNKKSSINAIASYISKYIAKSFEEGALNKKRYWSSKGIGEPTKEVHLLRADWSYGQVLAYIVEIFDDKGFDFAFGATWCNVPKGLFWMSTP